MEDTWICRDYQDYDAAQVLTLYKQVNNREMTSTHLAWKYFSSPFGKSVIKLMFDGDILIGFYAASPVTVQVEGDPVKAALSVNTMTHPDYRGKGIFPYLGKKTYQACEQKGIKFVYGFPNNNIYKSRIRNLEWIGFGKMSILERNSESSAAVAGATDIHEIDKFDSRINLLWEKTKAGNNVIVPRNQEFLNWKFVQRPTVEYFKYIHTDEANNVAGYLVLKTYTGGNEDTGHIVDILCINNEDVVTSLVRFSCNYFFQRGIKRLSCWVPEDSLYSQVLVGEGFTRQETETYFGVKPLDKEDVSVRNVEQFRNWHLTMADSDVF